MSTQQAWIVTQKGLPKDALVLKKDYPVPKPGKGEVIVKVQAAALNPVGYKVMKMLPNYFAKRPLPAEYDLAGTIEDPNGSTFAKGDPVFGYISVPLSMKTKEGALQQYARLPADCVVIRPPNITAIEASGLTLAGETAWHALLELGGLEAGQSVFINGGSSAVGAYAIQIAKAKGAARVVVTASAKNEEFVRNLGADEFIDYTKEPIHQYLLKNPPSTKFNVVFDAVGLEEPALYQNSPAYLAPGGAYVTVGTSGNSILPLIRTLFAVVLPKWLGGTPRPYKMFFVPHKPAVLQGIADLVAEGKLKPLVDSVYEFEDVLSAYERLMTSRARGKVVVKVDPSVS